MSINRHVLRPRNIPHRVRHLLGKHFLAAICCECSFLLARALTDCVMGIGYCRILRKGYRRRSGRSRRLCGGRDIVFSICPSCWRRTLLYLGFELFSQQSACYMRPVLAFAWHFGALFRILESDGLFRMWLFYCFSGLWLLAQEYQESMAW